VTSATRRRLLAGGACLAAWPWAASALSHPGVRDSRPLMGTRVDITARGADAVVLRKATDEAYARMAALADAMSHYQVTSRVSAVGLAAGLQPVEVPRELMQVLQMAQGLSRRSGGAFDATVGSFGLWSFDPPRQVAKGQAGADWRSLVLDDKRGTAYLARRGMRLDLGGVAKLYILQAGLDTLKSHGVRSALVNGGGDVLAMSAPGDTPWRVGIRNPHAPQKLLAQLEVRSGFVASSGDYERYFMQGGERWHHVLDPRTGRPAQGVHGVTLVGDSLEAVNGLGAAAMVLGPREGRELLRRHSDAQALIASGDGELWISEKLRGRLRA
jgi:thiamine biosynthesis lipoprotein